MTTSDTSYALVLAGGGARGSYQIGAWKALREEKIKIQAIAGTSVGALNAGLIAMESFNLAEEIWESISFNKIVSMPEEFISDGNLKLDVRNIQAFTKYLIKNKGLDTLPLYRIIRSNLNENQIRKSGIDLGMVTFNISSFTPREVFLHHIPQGYLARYLLASASFPIFKSVEIDGRHFTDGGIYENIPYAMIKSRGYRHIIVMDISGLGLSRKPGIFGTQTVYIKNSKNIGWDLDFSADKVLENKTLGYLDTRKIFGKNSGFDYFIVPDRRLEHEIEAKLVREPNRKGILEILDSLQIEGNTYVERLENALPKRHRHTRSLGMSYLECAARCLDIYQIKEYTFKELRDLTADTHARLKKMTHHPGKEHDVGRFIKTLKRRFEQLTGTRDVFDLTPAEYARIGHMVFGKDSHWIRLKTISAIFPEIVSAKIFDIAMTEDIHKP